MMSDREFYLEQYRRCCEGYRSTPTDQRRQREFYNRLGASMLAAYVEAMNVELA